MQNRDGQKKYDQMTPAQERYMNIMYDFFQLADKSGDDGAAAAIKNDSDTPALETLYAYTKQEDGSYTRPLGELPRLES